MRIRPKHLLPQICIIGLCAGCCSIPSKTPTLIRLTNERIQDRAVVISQSFQTVLDEVEFTRMDVEDVRKTLEAFDTTNLTADQQTSLASCIQNLQDIEQKLTFDEPIRRMPADTRRIFEDIGSSLRLVQEVIGTEVDRQHLVEDMIEILKPGKGD